MSYSLIKKMPDSLKYCDQCVNNDQAGKKPDNIVHFDVVKVRHLPTDKKKYLCADCYKFLTGMAIDIRKGD